MKDISFFFFFFCLINIEIDRTAMIEEGWICHERAFIFQVTFVCVCVCLKENIDVAGPRHPPHLLPKNLKLFSPFIPPLGTPRRRIRICPIFEYRANMI